MKSVLEQIRLRLGPAPRRILPEDRRRLVTRPPVWAVHNKDALVEFYRNQELLLREGDVVWGALVQANGTLYGIGPSDSPATAIYSSEPVFECDPERLVLVARHLHALRGASRADPDEHHYGAMLENELERAMGIDIPHSHSGGLKIRSTTIMVRRAHLPGRMLRGSHFPLLIHPDTSAAMIVPADSWPDELAEPWRITPEEQNNPGWTRNHVSLTDTAAAWMHERPLLKALDVRISIDEPTDGFDVPGWELDFLYTMDPSRHYLSESHGIRIFIARSQADLFAGFCLGSRERNANAVVSEKGR